MTDLPVLIGLPAVVFVVALAAVLWTIRRRNPDEPRPQPQDASPGSGEEPLIPASGSGPAAATTVADLYEGYPDDYVLIGTPMVPTGYGLVSLRDWLVHYNSRRDRAWPGVVTTFYQRATADPAIAPFFTDTDPARLQRHFLAALTMIAGHGVSVRSVRMMKQAHDHVRNTRGEPISGEVFDTAIGTLTQVLAAEGVPDVAITQLDACVAVFRDVIATPPPRVGA